MITFQGKKQQSFFLESLIGLKMITSCFLTNQQVAFHFHWIYANDVLKEPVLFFPQIFFKHSKILLSEESSFFLITCHQFLKPESVG